MLSLRWAAIFVLLGGCGSGSDAGDLGPPARSIAMHAEVCGWLCDDRDANARPPGDFTGLACASQARIRLYQADVPAVERCVSFDATTRLTDLFAVSTGIPGGVPATPGMPVALPPIGDLTSVVAEVALYAPGGAACPADAPFVSLGRSAVIDLTATSTTAITVPLGCHASCATSRPRSISLRLQDPATGADLASGFGALDVGELYSYGTLIETAGQCMAARSLAAVEFRAYASTGGTPRQVTYGIDATRYGGCAALHGQRGGVTHYACLDDADGASPLGLVVPESEQARLAALRGSANNTPKYGTLIIQTADANGNPVDNTSLTTPGDVDVMALGAGYQSTLGSPFASWHGLFAVPDAPPGEYSADVVGQPGIGRVTVGGGAPGTITIVRLRIR